MAYENLIYKKEGGVAKITINRPKVMNAISPALLSEIKAAVQEAGKDDDVGVVVLTGVTNNPRLLQNSPFVGCSVSESWIRITFKDSARRGSKERWSAPLYQRIP